MNTQQNKKEENNNVEEAEETASSDESTKVEQLETRVKQLEDQVKYAIADYRNLEKRHEDERREFIKFASRDLLLRLLPAFDTLLLAGKYIKDEGLKITVKRLMDILSEVGVSRIETEGKKFDATLMEAVEVVEGKENMVVEETRPGFTLHGKVLTPAIVKVGGKK